MRDENLPKMRQGTCADCGLTTSIRSFYEFQGKTYCEPCVWRLSRQAKERGEPGDYVSLTDNSVCARCGAYSGDQSDHSIIGKLPLCGGCAALVKNWPYPTWLKTALTVLLVLFVVALIHGRKYFSAGRDMYLGERLVEQKRYAEAVPYLQNTLKTAPDSDKAALLTAKAALLSGNPLVAQDALEGHSGGSFEHGDDPDVQEVNALWGRAVDANKKAEQASKLIDQPGQAAEAAKLMNQAAAQYPELTLFTILAERYDEGAAFESKDYDRFLSLTQKRWKDHPDTQTNAALASALACKYATTGKASYRDQAEQLLHESEQMAQGDPKAQAEYQEYAERIRFRLETRVIIDRQEYNRRFRNGGAQNK